MSAPNTRRKFTTREIGTIRRWYYEKGAAWLAKRLGRTTSSIHAAHSKYRTRNAPEGYVRISDLADILDRAESNIHKEADLDGVTRRIGQTANGSARLVVVPEGWAEGYIRLAEERTSAEATAVNWLTAKDCERIWRLGKGTVRRAFNNKGPLSRLLEGKRIVQGRSGRYLIHPDDAHSIRQAIDDLRPRPLEISTKSIAIDLGKKQQHVATVAKNLGLARKRLAGGRYCTFVTPQGRDELLRALVAAQPLPPPGFVAVCDLAREVGRHSLPNATRWFQRHSAGGMVKARHHSEQLAWFVPPAAAGRYREEFSLAAAA